MATSPDVLAVDRLTHGIRAVVRAAAMRGDISHAVIASALMYELAACLAFAAKDIPTALTMVDETVPVMKEQIRAFATLDEHP